MEITITDISPKLAESWLAKNTTNRPINRRNVAKIAGDIQRGAWRSNGETIKIAPDGTLVDGQHRLIAIAETGISVPSAVAYNVPMETQLTVDTGRVRSSGHVLTILGYRNSSRLAAVARSVHLYLAGEEITRGAHPDVTHSQVVNVVEIAGAELEACITEASGAQSAVRQVSQYAAALYLIKQGGRGDLSAVDEFVRGVRTGANLRTGDPILALRTRLNGLHSAGKRTHPSLYKAFILQAWLHRQSGVRVQMLRTPKNMPVVPFPADLRRDLLNVDEVA